ncbi:MAG: DUF4276 family protein, partial [Planctomycetes bacterium]|nr:DUF4276 family protein [Planctomycetota bacterium]
EGQAEVESVPILLRRLLTDLGASDLLISTPFRVKRNRVVKEGELERAIKQAIRSRPDVRTVLVLLDSDDDCPARLGPELVGRCKRATHLPAAVVLAQKELECWFLGAKESFRGVRGIRRDAIAPPDAEAIRGAKQHLTRNMEKGYRYLEVDDQPAMLDEIDLGLARERCPSFARLCREIAGLVSEMKKVG